MNYEEFKNTIIKELPIYLPTQYQKWEIHLTECIKVNGFREMIHVIPPEECVASPNIYLDDLYEFYETFGSIEKACQRAAAYFVAGMDYLSDYEMCSAEKFSEDQVIFCLVPQNGNERLLASVPHRLTMDLAVIYRIVVETKEGAMNSAIITKDIADEMKVTEDRLYQLAMINTPVFMPPDVRAGDGPFLLLTNQRKVLGASVMLYPGLLAMLAEELKSDLFILPSSLHEVLIMPDEGQDVQGMNRVIAEANHSVIPKEDILSDHAYYYHRETDQVCVPKWE